MIDGNLLRAEFAKYLNEHTHTRWGLDAALMHVCRIAYEQGAKDGASQSGADLLPVWSGRTPLGQLPLADRCYVCGEEFKSFDIIEHETIGGDTRTKHSTC